MKACLLVAGQRAGRPYQSEARPFEVQGNRAASLGPANVNRAAG